VTPTDGFDETEATPVIRPTEGTRPHALPEELRVLALIDHLALGGAEMLLGQFAGAAPAVGIHLSVACLTERDGNPAAEPLRAAGIEPVNLHARERLGVRALLTVRRYITEVHPDIVHTHLGTAGIHGSIASRSLGVPSIASIHAMAWSADHARARARLKLGAVARRHGAARIVTVSEAARRAYLGQGWDSPARVVVIHNGIDAVPERGAGAAVRRELGLESDALVLGMFSALRPEKGHDIAISALPLLRTRFPNLRLLIAGDGPIRAELSRLALPFGDAIVMTGPRFDVMRLLDATDLCLQPSREDAFPTTLLEAMAASVPVVATGVGGIPEIVVHDHTGVLVDSPLTAEQLAEAVASLLDDAPRRRDLGAAGRRRYEERFTADPWVRRTRALYDSVLTEFARPAAEAGGSRTAPADLVQVSEREE
jgi:glycosyltransferase involved in cell wall biosynthesis